MLERNDQLELLAFVEDELDAAQVAALRRRLTREPRVLAVLDQLRADRAELRQVPEPMLPRDFLAALEPYLARPMLIETNESVTEANARPGEFRRQYRRQTRRIRWNRIAVAAVLMIGLFVGGWAALNGWWQPSRSGSGDRMIARVDSSSAEVEETAARDLHGTIHHHIPFGTVEHARIEQGGTPLAADGSGGRVVADFAIVMRTDDPTFAENALISVAERFEGEIALVRNFSFAEAQRLAADRQRAPGSNEPRRADPLVASGRPIQSLAELKSLADRVRAQLAIPSVRSNRSNSDADSAHLAGVVEQAPSLEQQLDFSSRGATHSISVPLAELNALVEHLAIGEDQSTMLRMLPKSEALTASDRTALNDWVSEGPQVRQSFAALQQLSPETIVLIPVIIQNTK